MVAAGSRELTFGTVKGKARLVAVADGRELARIAHDTPVNAVAFSPDGTRLAIASDYNTVRLLVVADGHELARVSHDDVFTAVAFSPDGRLLATASDDKTARLLVVADGRELARIIDDGAVNAYDGAVNAVAFSPDGARLATAGQDGKIRFWSTTLDDMLRRLCLDPGRNPLQAEWRRYVSDVPWQPTCEDWPSPDD